MEHPHPEPLPGSLLDYEISYLKLLKTLRAAGEHGAADLGVVERIASWIEAEQVLHYICLNRRWWDDWGTKEALLRNEHTPAEFRRELEKQIAIFDLLRELDAPELSAEERQEIREDVRSLFSLLPEHDRAVVKQRAYDLSSSRHKAPAAGRELATEEIVVGVHGPLLVPPPEAVETAAQLAALETLIEQPARPPEVLPAPAEVEEPLPTPVVALAGDALTPQEVGGLSLEQRLVLARTTVQLPLLAALVADYHPGLHAALAANPALPEDLALMVARRADHRTAAEIYRNKQLFQRPRVRQALLDCPQAPAAALLEIVNTVGDLGGLLNILGSPKIQALEVKAKARSRLAERFRSMSAGEKVAAVRRGGRRLLKELWSDFFRDEALVLQCLQEKQLDEGTVLEIARSKISPRRALEVIGNTPAWVNNYQVTLSLVLNPKTPRQVVTRLMRKLNPADRRMVKNNPALPQSVRQLA